MNNAFNREAMDLLLFLRTPDIESVWYSGDGLLRFAGLIAGGLVKVKQLSFGGPAWGRFVVNGESPPPMPAPATGARVALSEKGALLVDSWLNGDERGYAKALGYELPASENE